MATQWNFEELPNEQEPNVPALTLPNADSVKEASNNIDSKSDNTKRLDLFALSEEMPTSLRGGLTNIEHRNPIKPSLTLVSEYLQSRGMRLRETGTANKKQTEDLQSIKQTILRTRSTRPEGSSLNPCHVLDQQIIPMPSWRAEKSCEFCSHSVSDHKQGAHLNATNSEFIKNFKSIRPTTPWGTLPSPVLGRASPCKWNKGYKEYSPLRFNSLVSIILIMF